MLIWAITVAVQHTKIMYHSDIYTFLTYVPSWYCPDICTFWAYVPSRLMYSPYVCGLAGCNRITRQETKFGVQVHPFSAYVALVNVWSNDLNHRAPRIYSFLSCSRLVQQPNCIKVPKEICVNAKTNPRKVNSRFPALCALPHKFL